MKVPPASFLLTSALLKKTCTYMLVKRTNLFPSKHSFSSNFYFILLSVPFTSAYSVKMNKAANSHDLKQKTSLPPEIKHANQNKNFHAMQTGLNEKKTLTFSILMKSKCNEVLQLQWSSSNRMLPVLSNVRHDIPAKPTNPIRLHDSIFKRKRNCKAGEVTENYEEKIQGHEHYIEYTAVNRAYRSLKRRKCKSAPKNPNYKDKNYKSRMQL